MQTWTLIINKIGTEAKLTDILNELYREKVQLVARKPANLLCLCSSHESRSDGAEQFNFTLHHSNEFQINILKERQSKCQIVLSNTNGSI